MSDDLKGWTIDPPTRSGWYWLACVTGPGWREPQVAHVTVGAQGVIVRRARDAEPTAALPPTHALNSLRWLGPLAEPQAPAGHAAALHNVVVAARAFVKESSPRNDADGAREALIRALAALDGTLGCGGQP